MRHVIAIDQGTTGSTVLVLDEQLAVRGRGYQEFRQIYPAARLGRARPRGHLGVGARRARPGAARASTPSSIAAIGITNQRETTVLWDRKTGKRRPQRDRLAGPPHRRPLRRARSRAATRRASSSSPASPSIRTSPARRSAGCCDNVPASPRAARAGELAFGTIDSYLLWRLTGGAVHATDVTNASRTLLFDLHDARVERRAARAARRAARAAAGRSSRRRGRSATTTGVPGLPDGIPIAGIAGDQQAALFGQACFAPGDAKCTYGTGAFILMNTGDRPVRVASRACSPPSRGSSATGELRYALEGSAFIAGAAVQWLRDGLGFITSAAEIEALARSVPDSGGVIVVPAFAGLGAPHWRPDARGAITGLTRGTTRAHIARATLEGIALQNVDILRAMERDAGRPLTRAQGRRRRGGERPADAVPERRARRRDLAARARRDHRARRRVPRRPRHRRVEGSGRRSRRPGASSAGSSRPPIARAVDEHLARWDAAVAKA